MAIELKNFPIDKTIFELVREQTGRKQRVKDYIDGVGKKYPSLQSKITDFWTKHQTEYDGMSDSSTVGIWKAFFKKFNNIKDLVEELNKETLKEFDTIFAINPMDDDLTQTLKSIAKYLKDDMNPYFDDFEGGVAWILFLTETFKQFYLVELPRQISNELTKGGKTFVQLYGGAKDMFQLKSCFNKSFEILYSSFNKTEDEPDLDGLIDETNKNLQNIADIVGNIKPSEAEKDNAKLVKLVGELTKLLEQIYNNYPEILYGTTPSPTPAPDIKPTPVDPSKPDVKPTTIPTPTPDPVKPTPSPITPPTKTPEELEAERKEAERLAKEEADRKQKEEEVRKETERLAQEARELQALKDEISKLPLNSTEQTELTNAKTKPEAEVVRTKYNTRVNRAQAEKDEVAKYDKILTDIKGETNQDKLLDGKDYDNSIIALTDDLLKTTANKDKNTLQAERRRKWQQLEKDRLTTIETAKYDKLLNDIQGETVANIKDLEDKSKYDQAIGKLEPTYLPADRAIASIQTKRHEKLVELTKIQLQNAIANALLKDADGNDWDPALDSEEQKLVNSASNLTEVANQQTQIKIKKDNIATASDLLNQLNNWKEITTLPKMAEIRAKYDETLVPDGLKYLQMKVARNAIRLKLFKDRFDKPTPTGLSDVEIDKWRDSSDATGLSGLGVEERLAFKNNWKIEDIKDKKVAEYKIKAETEESVKDVDVLKVDKNKLDEALKILASINDSAKTTFKSLPADYKKAQIDALPNDLPSNANPTYLTQRIKDKRDTFSLSLNNEPDDGGFAQTKLDAILAKIKDKYPLNEYKPFTAELANKVLKYNIAKENKTVKKDKEVVLAPIKDLVATMDEDLDAWLTDPAQKGYRIEEQGEQLIKGQLMRGDEVVKQEEDWIATNQRDKQGKLLLPFFCAKVSYDPNQPEQFFCEDGDTVKGCLPYATGSGKTTKIVMCLEFIMEQINKLWQQTNKKRNVVLVLPTKVLASSAYNHHTSWLQEYECPIHDIKHGEYKVNKDTIDEGLSIVYFPTLLGYVAREFVKYDGVENGKKFDLSTITDKSAKEKLKVIQDGTVLKKLQPIIVFDEAHFADPEYKATMEGFVKQGYKCLKMSATFPNVPWSITTSYPSQGRTRKVDGFIPDHIKPTDKTGIFIKNKLLPEQKAILNKAGVCWVEFDASMAPVAEGITFGLPKGSVFFMTWIYEMGISPDFDNTIITNWIETTKLGDYAGKGTWFYSTPETQKCPIASLGQQRGRCFRLRTGKVYILVDKDGKLEYEEIKQTNDLGTILIQAIFSGNTSKVKYDMLRNSYNLTVLGLAWPDKFGLRPEEILIGIEQGGVPPNVFPKFTETKKPVQGCDADLWDRHCKVMKPNDMPVEQAKDILAQMIGNLVVSPSKDSNFPKMVSVKIESGLIERIGWLASTKPNDKDQTKPWVKQDNKKSIQECQTMINGAIQKQLETLPNFVDGQVQYKDENTFKKIVDIYKCLDGMKVTITQEFKDELIDKKKPELGKKPKDTLTLKMVYNTAP